jgi:trehalose 6-phosphate phosphatase
VSAVLAGIPRAVWSMVHLASHRLLVIDYDGTLAPFTVVREEALPISRSLELLKALSKSSHTSLAITSGRPVDELEQLLDLQPAIHVGEYGWEYRMPGGPLVRHAMNARLESILNEAERLARNGGWSDHLERKRTAVMLHTRRLSEFRARDLEHRVLVTWLDLASRGEVVVERVDGGVELRARGHDAGTTALWLMSLSEQATLGAFIGDDLPDEAAFRVMSDFGFGIRVGGPERSSLALGHLPTCEAVADFLDEWIRVVGE